MNVGETATYEYVCAAMSTTVSVQIVGAHPNAEFLAASALDWFRLVESTCSRFDEQSELVRVCTASPTTAGVSPLLFEVLRVALAVADASHGAFDPTLGSTLAAMGFDTHWQSGVTIRHEFPAVRPDWRRIALDETHGTLTLPQRVMLDLGAIAKGFALDLAARALSGVADCCIVAGGDLLCRGVNGAGHAWRTAIVDPFSPTHAIGVVEVHAPEYAICSSGGYQRKGAAGHHLLDARASDAPPRSAEQLASVTVIAPQAAIADALATAAFVLGAEHATPLLTAQGVDAVLVDTHGAIHEVRGWQRTTFFATRS